MAVHHERTEGLWLITHRKGSGLPVLAYDELVEEALCWGWIDSLPRALDESRTMLWLAPRKPGSNWSRLNKTRAERMIAEGRMQPSGLSKIDQAKVDGSWDALNEVADLIVPADLAASLAELPPARENWDAFPPSARRGILEWIQNARRAETRAKRVAETARLAQQNIRALSPAARSSLPPINGEGG
ncbi:MAG: YdeI/OmpD-associated family protein [Fimbriimonadaceae bacterium]|nr:YdeI/OmpD-associated family protein [Fimbriimonadaceae bacterium]